MMKLNLNCAGSDKYFRTYTTYEYEYEYENFILVQHIDDT